MGAGLINLYDEEDPEGSILSFHKFLDPNFRLLSSKQSFYDEALFLEMHCALNIAIGEISDTISSCAHLDIDDTRLSVVVGEIWKNQIAIRIICARNVGKQKRFILDIRIRVVFGVRLVVCNVVIRQLLVQLFIFWIFICKGNKSISILVDARNRTGTNQCIQSAYKDHNILEDIWELESAHEEVFRNLVSHLENMASQSIDDEEYWGNRIVIILCRLSCK